MIIYAATIFASAFLLFLIQPIIAKQILPWFGGSASVWTTCLVFFQFALLAGYFYADWVTKKLKFKQQAILHVTLVLIALALLPIIPDAAWKPVGNEEPGMRILLLLAATIGLPYFLLSTTSPLVQAWFARSYPAASPYRLFALSNLASMLALLGYPFLFEPWITTQQQALGWSIGFGLFAALIASAAWFTVKSRLITDGAPDTVLNTTENTTSDATQTILSSQSTYISPSPPAIADKLLWAALAASGSVLLLAISNHLTQNISSIPLMWVVPLALYLLTFILCFDGTNWYRRKIILPLLAIAIMSMAYTLADTRLHFELYFQIGLFSAGLFIACMFCHGELAARKPAPRYLTTFYLMISVGGASGALLVGVIAPLTLPAYFELEIALVMLAGLAMCLWWRKKPVAVFAAGAVVTLFSASAALFTVAEFNKNVVVMTRNFYGTLRVKEYGPPAEEYRRRSLIHGAILHGNQYRDPPYNRSATTYYKAKSGIGRTILLKEKLAEKNSLGPLRVGVIGLGTGTIATYGSKGDVYRFYDINPEVVTIAQRDFTYLQDSDAKIEIALGDARLNLEREATQNRSQQFDVLAIDAFSSDSIPVHLITLEALAIYEKHMKPDGVIAFHVSNRYLDLKPVVQLIAEARGLQVAWVRDTYEDGATTSDWILLARLTKLTADQDFLLKPEIAEGTFIIPPDPNPHARRVWTDDFNNLLQVLK